MTYGRFPIFVTTAVAATVAWAPAIFAQAGGTQPPTAQQQPPAMQQQQPGSAQYGESELKSYANAAAHVQRISATYQPQIQAAESSEDQQQLQQQAVEQMSNAVRSEGLSVEKYNEITGALQTNPQLAERVQTYMNQAN